MMRLCIVISGVLTLGMAMGVSSILGTIMIGLSLTAAFSVIVIVALFFRSTAVRLQVSGHCWSALSCWYCGSWYRQYAFPECYLYGMVCLHFDLRRCSGTAAWQKLVADTAE